VLVELRSKRHGVDGYELALVVGDYYFKKPASSIGADGEVSVALGEHADGVGTACSPSRSPTPFL